MQGSADPGDRPDPGRGGRNTADDRPRAAEDGPRVTEDGPRVAGDGCCPGLLAAPLAEDQAIELAAVFKALGDPVRLRLLSIIASRAGGEVCVCELTPAFDLAQPTISHHLKLLRQAGLIDSERRGTWVYYRLLPGPLDRLAALLSRPAALPLRPVGPVGDPVPAPPG